MSEKLALTDETGRAMIAAINRLKDVFAQSGSSGSSGSSSPHGTMTVNSNGYYDVSGVANLNVETGDGTGREIRLITDSDDVYLVRQVSGSWESLPLTKLGSYYRGALPFNGLYRAYAYFVIDSDRNITRQSFENVSLDVHNEVEISGSDLRVGDIFLTKDRYGFHEPWLVINANLPGTPGYKQCLGDSYFAYYWEQNYFTSQYDSDYVWPEPYTDTNGNVVYLFKDSGFTLINPVLSQYSEFINSCTYYKIIASTDELPEATLENYYAYIEGDLPFYYIVLNDAVYSLDYDGTNVYWYSGYVGSRGLTIFPLKTFDVSNTTLLNGELIENDNA